MLRFIAAGMLVLAELLMVSPDASADVDEHLPDISALYCPGGSGGVPSVAGYCDGAPYPDGSFWHMVSFPTVVGPGVYTSVACVVERTGVPRGAPSGGCDGAV